MNIIDKTSIIKIAAFIFLTSSFVSASEEYQWRNILLPDAVDNTFKANCKEGLPLKYCKKNIASLVAMKFIEANNQYYGALINDRFQKLPEDEKNAVGSFNTLIGIEQKRIATYWLEHSRLPDIPSKQTENQ